MMRCFVILLAILVSAASVARSSPTTQPATTQSLSTTVTAQMLDTNQPVPDATVRWEGDGHLKGSAQTSANGDCQITNIPTPCHWIGVSISKPGLVPLRIFWNDSKGAALPKRIAFGMEKGVPISGLVVDDAGQPIPNAHVVAHINKKYPNSDQDLDFFWKKTRANEKGHWSIDGVPADSAKIQIGAYDFHHLDGEYFYLTPFTHPSKLFDGTARFTLPRGTPISLTVLKPDGSPAPAATILLGPDRRVSNIYDEFKTDPTGHTSIGGKPGLAILATATLDGFGPGQANVSTTDKPQSITIKLTTPTTRSIEVIDSDGKPIPGADVSIEDWNRNRILDYDETTDAVGKATWKDGPADGITADIHAQGFTGQSQIAWPPNQTTRIVLSRPTDITAHITDADTGKPIPLFSVRTAAVWRDNDLPVWQDMDFFRDSLKKQPGQFTLHIDQPARQYLFRVIADGYLPDDIPLFQPDGKTRTFDLKLKKAPDISAKILSADDKPIAGAKVYIMSNNEWVYLANGDMVPNYEQDVLHTSSSADGSFTLPPRRDKFVLQAISDYGIGSITSDKLSKPDTPLHLSPWATIHGTLLIAGKPAAKVAIMGTSPQIYADPASTDSVVGVQRYNFTTDPNGKFELKRVPPGRLNLTRPVPNHSPGRQWYIGVGTIDVKPGQTYNLTFGQGASVTGLLLIPKNKQWMIRQSRIEPKGQPHIEDWENVEVTDDGHFRADGLSPGDYTLHIALHEFPPNNDCGWGRIVGEYTKDVTITSPTAAIDLGTLSPDPIVQADLDVGDPAPDFTVQTTDGKSIHLSDLKGKLVLLDFWATWCAPCVAEMPNLQKIQSAYANNPHFAMLSLSLDDNESDLKRFITLSHYTWPMAWLGIDSPLVKTYGATAIPATFLISPTGKILAKDLRGDALRNQIDQQLK